MAAQQTTLKNELGTALLVIEFEGGAYQPVAVVSTLAEARQLTQYDARARAASAGTANEQPSPACYRLWVRNFQGEFQPATEIEF